MSNVFDLNLRHLQAIAVIGRAGSMSAGALKVNLSQPAVAQAVGKVSGCWANVSLTGSPVG